MDLKIIGIGNTAVVYEYSNDKVLKLFKEGYPKSYIEHEFANAIKVNELIFNKINSYDLIQKKNQYGIIYDKVNGSTLLERLMINYNEYSYAGKLMAREHNIILNNSSNSFYQIVDKLKRDVVESYLLEESQKNMLVKIIDSLPRENTVCHGDFHPGNLIISDKNYVIDYMNICIGHPHYDIARTIYLTEMTPMPDLGEKTKDIAIIRNNLIDIYLEEISVLRAEKITRDSLKNWLLAIAGSRLTEIDNEDERNLIKGYLFTMGIV